MQRDRVANLLLAYKSRWGGGTLVYLFTRNHVVAISIRAACSPSCSFDLCMPPASRPPAPTDSHRNGGGVGKAAEELARGAAREALGPLLDAACARLGAVVKRAYDIAADQAQHQRGAGEGWRME